MIYSVRTIIAGIIAAKLKTSGGWANTCNALGVMLQDGRVVNSPASAGRDFTYIGIDDSRGTYVYLRDNSLQLSVGRALLGSCENGQTVRSEIRAVAVSNNLQNTPQMLADKLFTDLSKIRIPNTALYSDALIIPTAAYHIQHDIYLSEIGQQPNDGKLSRVVLAAVDFNIEFIMSDCSAQSPKICI